MIRLLLLGGTAEARALAGRLAGRARLEATVSLAGTTRLAAALPLPVRVGGFGGAAGQAAWMRAHGVTHVIDATHPFAARISGRTAVLCREMGIACLQLLRPGWTPGDGDRWEMIGAEEEAEAQVAPGARVLLATGRQRLGAFAGLARKLGPQGHLWCRQIDPPDAPFPFENGDYLLGRPPFPVAAEVELFRRLGIDWLVAKDSGGAASRTKLDAARELALPVLLIRRPPQPEVERVETVAAALEWLER